MKSAINKIELSELTQSEEDTLAIALAGHDAGSSNIWNTDLLKVRFWNGDAFESIDDITTEDIPLLPTQDQKDALDNSGSPSLSNPFVTQADIIGGLPTGEIPTTFLSDSSTRVMNDASFADVPNTTVEVTTASPVPLWAILSFEINESGGGSSTEGDIRIVINGIAGDGIHVDNANRDNQTGSTHLKVVSQGIGTFSAKVQMQRTMGSKNFEIRKSKIMLLALQAPKGDTGQGVPTGGTTAQVLSKADNTDYNTQWNTIYDGLTKITVGTSEPTSPNVGDLWVDIN